MCDVDTSCPWYKVTKLPVLIVYKNMYILTKFISIQKPTLYMHTQRLDASVCIEHVFNIHAVHFTSMYAYMLYVYKMCIVSTSGFAVKDHYKSSPMQYMHT